MRPGISIAMPIGSPVDQHVVTTVTNYATAAGAVATAWWGGKKAWEYFWDIYVPRRMKGQASLKAVPEIQKSLTDHSTVLKDQGVILKDQSKVLADLTDLIKRGQEVRETQQRETLDQLKSIAGQVQDVIRRQDSAEDRQNTDARNMLLTRRTLHWHGKVLMHAMHFLQEVGKMTGCVVPDAPPREDDYLSEEWDRLSGGGTK